MSHQSLTPQQQAELTEFFALTQVTSQQMKELCEQAEAFDRKLEKRLGGSQTKSQVS